MEHSNTSGGSAGRRSARFAAERGESSFLRRTVACAGVSALVIGAVLTGPGLAFANSDEAPTQQQTAEVAPDEQTDPTTGDAEKSNSEGADADEKTSGDAEQPTDAEKTVAEEKLSEKTAAEKVDAEPAAEAIAFDKVFIKQDRQYQGGAVDVAYELSIPDAVKQGDTIQLTFQAPLDYDNSVETVLRDADGEIVATGKLTDAKNRVITFTFTDYVDKNKNVTIAGEFAMIANDPTLEGNLDGKSTTHEITFTQGENEFKDTLVIDPHSRTPLTKVFNYGAWTGEDKGRDKPENAILWTANSPEGQWEGMTVSLEPANSTSTFECSTLKFYTVEVPDGALYHNKNYDNDEQRTLNGTIDQKPSFVESVSCDEDKVSVTYKGHIDDNFLRQFTLEASVKDRDQIGHFGSVVRGTAITASAGAVECPDPVWGGDYVDYASACALQDTHWYNFVARDAAVGGGEGENRDARITVEKFSTGDGLEKGDFDVTPGKTLKKGATEKITFEITNTGEESLSEIKLSDKTIVGAELKMTSCDLEGVTLAAGESARCEGEVTLAKPGQHGDTATVTAVARGGAKVTDTDDWWGMVAADPVKPPVPPKPKPPVPGKPTPPAKPGEPVKPTAPAKQALATTGADSTLFGAVAAGVLALGGGAALLASRRRKLQEN